MCGPWIRGSAAAERWLAVGRRPRRITRQRADLLRAWNVSENRVTRAKYTGELISEVASVLCLTAFICWKYQSGTNFQFCAMFCALAAGNLRLKIGR